MLDSIHIGTSSLQTHAAGLKVISNNVANLNTPGFKSSDVRFASMLFVGGEAGFGDASGRFGSGVMAGEAFVNFQAGETRQTGNPLDLSIAGEGFFVTQDARDSSKTQYSRDGQFEFNRDGLLVSRTNGQQVLGLGAGKELTPISLNGLRISAPKATTRVELSGNVSSGATEASIDLARIIDVVGGERSLKLRLRPKSGETGTWTVGVLEGDNEIASGEVRFAAGTIVAGSDRLKFNYAPDGLTGTEIEIDFSKNVTSFNTGTTSSISAASTDGRGVGTLTQLTFDDKGQLSLVYSNGERSTGPQLAMATFDTTADLNSVDGSAFTDPQGAHNAQRHIGSAGSGRFGSVQANRVEASNVDLSTEFSDLIVTQRGYQAASRVVSTASEMLQDLFELTGRR